MLEDLIRAWDGEEVVVGFDEPSGTWMFVCIHSTRLGPAGGGTQMKAYASPADALRDTMNLSEGMTLKMAAAGVPFGGGKAVVAVPELPAGDERRRILLRYAELAASLGKTFHTGPDVNTSSADMMSSPRSIPTCTAAARSEADPATRARTRREGFSTGFAQALATRTAPTIWAPAPCSFRV